MICTIWSAFAWTEKFNFCDCMDSTVHAIFHTQKSADVNWLLHMTIRTRQISGYIYRVCAHEIVSPPGLVLGKSVLHLTLGVVGGILVLVLLVATSFFIVCKAKGLTLQKQQVRL